MEIFNRKIRVGTRGSQLALWQAEEVKRLILERYPNYSCELVLITTSGDRSQAAGIPLPEIGGKGLFTAELEEGLLAGTIDCAVHALKDLPTERPDGVLLAGFLKRWGVEDVLVAPEGRTLKDLPSGARIGSSSLRRKLQIELLRRDLNVVSVRGNVNTRVEKGLSGFDQLSAVVVARAGIERIGLGDKITEVFSVDQIVPPASQGIIGIDCRENDLDMQAILLEIGCPVARWQAETERAFLRLLGAGCSTPLGCYAEPLESDFVRLRVFAGDPQSGDCFRFSEVAPRAQALQLVENAVAAVREQSLVTTKCQGL